MVSERPNNRRCNRTYRPKAKARGKVATKTLQPKQQLQPEGVVCMVCVCLSKVGCVSRAAGIERMVRLCITATGTKSASKAE